MKNTFITPLLLCFFCLLFSCGESPFLGKLEKKVREGITSIESDESDDNEDDRDARDTGSDQFRNREFLDLGEYRVYLPHARHQDFILYDANELILDFTVNDQHVEVEQEISIDLWMPDHGHGSYPVKIKKLSIGRYLVSDIFFVMPGKWQVRIDLRKDGEQVDRAIWELML